VSIAGEDTDFAYNLCNDGTELDTESDMEALYRLLGTGYVGFAPGDLNGIITVYRPFRLGIRQHFMNGGKGSNLPRWIGAGEC
jgi:hypothetical protein